MLLHRALRASALVTGLSLLVACTTPQEKAAEAVAAGVTALESDPAAARRHFEKARELDPDNREAAARLARLHLEADRYAEAAEQARAALDLEAAVAELEVLAHAQLGLEQNDEALATIERALEAGSTDEALVAAKARLTAPPAPPEPAEPPEPPTDRAGLEDYLRQFPQESEAWLALAELQLAAGDERAGKQSLMRARNFRPWGSPERRALNERIAEMEGVEIEQIERLDRLVHQLQMGRATARPAEATPPE